MNLHYKNRYDSFISRVKNLGNRTFNEYTEIHHIQPKCLKGTDDPNNLIELTLREHFLAHWLLWKSYPDYLPLSSAFLQMNNKNPHLPFKGFQGRITSKTYKELKTSVYNKLREYTTDKVNVRDDQGNLIILSKEEYRNQQQYKFHTTGKIYVFDQEIEKWVYITTTEYQENKNRYHTRLSNSSPVSIKYNFMDTQTDQIVKFTKQEARTLNKEIGYKRFKHIQNHMVTCLDNQGKKYVVSLEEYRTGLHTAIYTHSLKDKVTVFDLSLEQTVQISLEEYYKDKNRYLTSTKGKVLARDQNGNNKLISKKEFESGQYVGQTKGLTTVYNKETNKYIQVTQTEFLNNKHKYTGPNKGKVNAINKITGERCQIPKDKFDKEIHAGIGNKKLLFKCRNKLTNKEKNINIYEWNLVQNQYEILEMDKFHIALNCK